MKVKLWCCVGKSSNKELIYDYASIATTRKYSIKDFLQNVENNWRWFKRNGWKCIKVEVEINTIKKSHERRYCRNNDGINPLYGGFGKRKL